jgi:hypothetical protein
MSHKNFTLLQNYCALRASRKSPTPHTPRTTFTQCTTCTTVHRPDPLYMDEDGTLMMNFNDWCLKSPTWDIHIHLVSRGPGRIYKFNLEVCLTRILIQNQIFSIFPVQCDWYLYMATISKLGLNSIPEQREFITLRKNFNRQSEFLG